ncbi:metalloreductase STEAP4-like isoform X1 [Haliotis cracherodii]|uniref:metalloreductase STEAP4-like isoform X1 n=2 Tax=Haliotis cracherodii TaxID=6455 RepID=UPI0039E8D82E
MACCQPMIARSNSSEDKMQGEDKESSKTVGIIGTGNFGRALAKRLIFSGYDVIIGSRRPEYRQLSEYDECLCDVRLTSIKECVRLCKVVFISVHVENFKDTFSPLGELFTDKIVIDVSNRENICGHVSNSEYLMTFLPKAKIVKAFNIISAYIMENDIAGGSRKVFVAGNDVTARDEVCNIARDMGFAPVDFGGLKSARRIEAFVLRLFPGWKVPIFLTFAIFNLWCLYITYIYFIDRTAYRWDQIFVKVFNKPLCMTAITLMALTYMPGCIAGFVQIVYGTKHQRFPRWMDYWLKSRKQLGIICFVLVFAHVLISILLMSPTYYSSWFQSTAITVPGNLTDDLHLPMKTWMIWKGEAACLVGIIAFILLCLLATTTLPSVGDSLNWREWRFVQSTLGYTVLFLSICHVMVMGVPGWVKKGFPKAFGSITFLCLILPVTVFVMKLILTMPCVNKYVSKIRKGWERNTHPCLPHSRCKDSKCFGDEYVALRLGGMQNECGCSGASLPTTLRTPTCDCVV